MNVKQILALYDEEQRMSIEYPGLRREATEHAVRHVDLLGTDSVIVYSNLDANNADRVIQDQLSHFEKLGHDFEWKYYEHDSPPDLKHRLASSGFEVGEAESIVALDLQYMPETLTRPAIHDVRRITDVKQLDEVMIIQKEVFQTDEDSLTRRQIEHEMQTVPDSISVYVVYVDEQLVASAWIRFTPASQFASLWAGATLADFRRKGIYTALLAVRAQEALKRGKRFLTVDAGPMSLPILKKLGFQLLTVSYPCQWRAIR